MNLFLKNKLYLISFHFIYDTKQAEFILIVDEPNVSNPQQERNFLKLSFLNV